MRITMTCWIGVGKLAVAVEAAGPAEVRETVADDEPTRLTESSSRPRVTPRTITRRTGRVKPVPCRAVAGRRRIAGLHRESVRVEASTRSPESPEGSPLPANNIVGFAPLSNVRRAAERVQEIPGARYSFFSEARRRCRNRAAKSTAARMMIPTTSAKSMSERPRIELEEPDELENWIASLRLPPATLSDPEAGVAP